VTEEGDAHPNFKRVLADATPEDIVEFVSVTGLPARAVKTPWLDRYLRNESRIRAKIGSIKLACPTGLDCLSMCGLRDGIEKFGHFCIDTRLAAALRGDVSNGLFSGARVVAVRQRDPQRARSAGAAFDGGFAAGGRQTGRFCAELRVQLSVGN
jgi:nitronate monooxygenase